MSSHNGEVIVDNNRSLTPGVIAVNPPANDSRGSYSDEESHQDEDTPVQGAGSGNDYRFANDAFAVVDARPVTTTMLSMRRFNTPPQHRRNGSNDLYFGSACLPSCSSSLSSCSLFK